MAGFVGASKRVLDVGCAQGSLARLLVTNGCDVVGVDVNPAAAIAAREACREVVVADLDVEPLAPLVSGFGPFDAIVFGDVLEHVRNPLALLENARSLLSENGYVVASIPNVAHGAVRLAMLNGRFQYQEYGLLDETHLRFFTRSTCENLLTDAGFRIEELARTRVPLFAESDLVPEVRREDYQAAVIDEILADAEHETLQFVIRAHPISHDARLRVLAKRATDAQAEREAAELQATALRRELDDLRAQYRSASERGQELDRERNLHLAARDRADLVIAASAERVGEMQRRIDALEVAIHESREREAEKDTAFAARLTEATRQNERLSTQANALADDLVRRSAEYADLLSQTAALRRETDELRSERDRAIEELEAENAEHHALETHVTSLLDEMTEKMRAESEFLATEIEAIQSSVIWRARKALRKILRRH